MNSTVHPSASDLKDVRAPIVSIDSHVGPRLDEDLRQYCPSAYLDDFDRFTKQWNEDAVIKQLFGSGRASREDLIAEASNTRKTILRNVLTEGAWDPHARKADMDYAGVAADVIFHGLQAGRVDPLPFTGDLIAGKEDADNRELVALGRHMYNAWLADFISLEPWRHVGLAQLPMWDVKAAIEELTWAREAGLRGVNFPRTRAGVLPYNHPDWEPFWDACEDLDVTLTTHVQGAGVHEMAAQQGEGMFAIQLLEITGAAARTSTHQMVFGGVFRRHPKLRLVFTEQRGIWWQQLMDDMDEINNRLVEMGSASAGATPVYHKYAESWPSHFANHIYVGASFLAHFEAEAAIEGSYVSQVMWGEDYPHTEGCWQYPRFDGEYPMTRLALRDTFSGIPLEAVEQMVSSNATRVYGFDQQKLREVAQEINAPTYEELTTPPESIEDAATTTRAAFGAFRRPLKRPDALSASEMSH